MLGGEAQDNGCFETGRRRSANGGGDEADAANWVGPPISSFETGRRRSANGGGDEADAANWVQPRISSFETGRSRRPNCGGDEADAANWVQPRLSSFETGRRRSANGGGDEADAVNWVQPPISPISDISTTARMPVHKDAKFYNMNLECRGMAIIFNHEHFDNRNLESRTGTNIDSDNLSEVLKGLGFKVTVLVNLTHEEVFKYLKQTAKMNHNNFDCLLIAVLTHGEKGKLYAKDKLYYPDDLWYNFTGDKCPTLAGKPKLFFIQACEGDKFNGHVIPRSSTETDGSPAYKIPVHADFLIVFSTVPGYFSWRNTTRGSWFMQALCDELRNAGTDRDILTLLTFVCQRVALDLESNTSVLVPMHQQKQVPCITSMLTRQLVFSKK